MALMRRLNFVDQGLSDIPSHIFFACDTIVELHVSTNFLTVIPTEISLLQNLRGLYLSNNKISEIPHEIGSLVHLEDLYLGNNCIRVIPSEISKLQKLQILNVSENELTALNPVLCALKNLQSLVIRGNHQLQFPPPHVQAKGTKAILNFLSEFLDGGSDEIKYGLNTLRTDLKLLFNQPLTSDLQLFLSTPQTQRSFHVHKIILYSRSVLIREILEDFNTNSNFNSDKLSFNSNHYVLSAKFLPGTTDALHVRLSDPEILQQCQKLLEYIYSDSIDIASKSEAQTIKMLAEDFRVSSRIFTMCDHVILGSLREAPPSTLGKEIGRFVNYSLFEDITMEVEGEIFYAHKAIVCRCEYFKALLTSGFGESRQDCIHMTDISKDAFVEVLRYLYSDTAQLTTDNVVEILTFSVQYVGLERLRRMCEVFLSELIDMDCALDLLLVSEQCGSTYLKSLCLFFAMSHVKECQKQSQWKTIPENLKNEILNKSKTFGYR